MGQRPGNSRNQVSLDPQTSPRELFKVLAVCCLLALMVLLVFGQASHFEFIVCDDDPYVYGNPHVVEGLSPRAWRNWTDNPLYWSLTTTTAGNWHPLTWMSHIIDGQLWGIHDLRFFGPGSPEHWKGPEAGGHHMTSVLLHAAAAIFLFLAMRRLTAAFWCSALAATIFAIHPLRAESVAWVAERKDVLSGLFWMLTLWTYANYALRPSIGRYLALVAVFAVGLSAKSMLVTLPCVLLLLDFWPLRRWQPQQLAAEPAEQSPSRCAPQSLGWLVLEKLPLFALSAIVSTIVAVGQRRMGCMSMTDNVSFPYRIANAAFSGADYLWKLVCPLDLAIFYPHLAIMGDEAKARLVWYGIAGGLVLAAITVFVLWNLRRRPYLAVGWFWYLGTLVPVIGLIQVGAGDGRSLHLPPHDRRDDHAGLGRGRIGGTVASLADRIDRRGGSRAGGVGGPRVRPGLDLGNQRDRVPTCGRRDQRQLLRLQPSWPGISVRPLPRTHGESRGTVQESGSLWPQLRRGQRESRRVLHELEPTRYGAAVSSSGQPNVNPFAAFHHANLAGVYFALNRFDDAGVQLREAIRIEPNSPRYHQSLALVYVRQQKPAKAIAELDEVLQQSPMDAGAMKDIAWFLATSPDASIRDGRRALALAQRANEITKESDPLVLIALSAAYAETGRFEEAVETASEAAKIAAGENNKSLVDLCRELIRIFASGSPFRQALPPPPTGLAPSP